MIKAYLLIELLHTAEADAVAAQLRALTLGTSHLAGVAALASDKLVAQLDCPDGAEASRVILERITPTAGIVQTSLVAAVHPTR